MNAYLSKPLGLPDLAEAIRRSPIPPASDASDAEPIAPPPLLLTGAAVDPTVLAQLAGSVGQEGNVLVRDLVAIFDRHAAECLLALRRAEDGEAVFRAAHSLKATSSQVGAVRLAGLCAQVEALGRRGRVAGLEPWIDAVAGEVRIVSDALREIVKSYADSG
jgi:HPt (histidine-containing phosphotransfer) domain-containing protein